MVFLDVGVLVWVLERWKGEFWDICNIGVFWYDREVNDVVFFGFFIIWFLGEVGFIISFYVIFFYFRFKIIMVISFRLEGGWFFLGYFGSCRFFNLRISFDFWEFGYLGV